MQKTFKTIRVITAFLLAVVMAQAVILNNYILAAVAVAAAIGVILISRKKVDEVLSDERDVQITGKSARLALSIFCVVGAVVTFILMAQRNSNYVFEVAGSTLAYSVCALLLLYSAIFYYYEKQN